MNWLDKDYPEWRTKGWVKTSETSTDYNCIAWAAGVSDDFWSYGPNHTWPSSIRTQSIESLVSVFKSIGYEPCNDGAPDKDHEKIALYAQNNKWTHASRQLPCGRWTSKLGPEEDITHPSAESVSGFYGPVHCYMKRTKSTSPQIY